MRFSRIFILFAAFALAACSDKPEHAGRTVIRYWDKWTGFEGDAMRAVVDDFNASQERIYVELSTVSQIDRKLMFATGGGVPPDVAGIWSYTIPIYAENNALTPLDRMAQQAGVRPEDYLDIFWKACSHLGHLWALPSTPATNALVWNKKMFRDAGLDPERPPRSIAELEEYNEKLLKRRPDGSMQSIGHLPEEPGWWNDLWGYWFGGQLCEDGRHVTVESPENIAAYSWVESYPQRFGAGQLLALREGFGNFSSPQNPFFTGRVAMVLQGVWIYNFIKNYAPPDFEWGVAPFPTSGADRLTRVSTAECDVLVIPHGAKHPREAFEFIRYVNSQGPMEKLTLGQRKFPPLRNVSEDFYRQHPNPFIRDFVALAASPNAFVVPRVATWTEFHSDMRNAVSRIWNGKATSVEALHDVQVRQQQALDRRMARWDRISKKLLAEWDRQ
jgi:ABC-type glycerol-3-phosphate transport system substrate-binding protein